MSIAYVRAFVDRSDMRSSVVAQPTKIGGDRISDRISGRELTPMMDLFHTMEKNRLQLSLTPSL